MRCGLTSERQARFVPFVCLFNFHNINCSLFVPNGYFYVFYNFFVTYKLESNHEPIFYYHHSLNFLFILACLVCCSSQYEAFIGCWWFIDLYFAIMNGVSTCFDRCSYLFCLLPVVIVHQFEVGCATSAPFFILVLFCYDKKEGKTWLNWRMTAMQPVMEYLI